MTTINAKPTPLVAPPESQFNKLHKRSVSLLPARTFLLIKNVIYRAGDNFSLFPYHPSHAVWGGVISAKNKSSLYPPPLIKNAKLRVRCHPSLLVGVKEPCPFAAFPLRFLLLYCVLIY